MIRVVVIDDEPLAREGVAARLACHTDMKLVGMYADGSAASEGLLEHAPDLAFVDVDMPGMNGFELLASLPQAQRPLAIMLTAYDSHALRAFELHAVDYLLKPIDDVRFGEALDRARQAVGYRRAEEVRPQSSTELSRFCIRVGNRTLVVDAQDVDWIEADGDYAALHVRDAVHLVRESLFRLATRLDPAQFVRIHRSAIVRVDRIVELETLVNRDTLLRLRDGTPLRASRTYIDDLKDALGRLGVRTAR